MCYLLFFTPCVSQPSDFKHGRLLQSHSLCSFGRLRGVAKIIDNTLSRNRFDDLGHYLRPHVPNKINLGIDFLKFFRYNRKN